MLFKKCFLPKGILAVFTLILWLSSCSSVPFQEMSDARQIVASVEAELDNSDNKKNTAIAEILHNAKQQLELAKNMLKQENYDKAKEYAKKASELAGLARLQMQQLNE